MHCLDAFISFDYMTVNHTQWTKAIAGMLKSLVNCYCDYKHSTRIAYKKNNDQDRKALEYQHVIKICIYRHIIIQYCLSHRQSDHYIDKVFEKQIH